MKYKNNKNKKYKNLCCPKCKSKEIIKRGFRKTQFRGKIQRYSCRCCNRRFVENNGFFRMRNNPKKITLSMDLFYRGLSTREIQSHLQAFYPRNSSNVSIYKWVIKYSKIISNFTDKLKIKSGSYVEVDEMEFHRRKSHKARLGVDKNWLINSIDIKTRYLIISNYSKRRNQREFKSVFRKIKEKTRNVRTITTDGLTQYPRVVKSVYGYYNLKKGLIKHKIVTASRGEGFNIWVERLHNSIRQRTHGFRGLHGSIESAYCLMKGIEIYYNFVRKHESLNYKTPSELATDVKLKNPNKWLELIKMSV